MPKKEKKCFTVTRCYWCHMQTKPSNCSDCKWVSLSFPVEMVRWIVLNKHSGSLCTYDLTYWHFCYMATQNNSLHKIHTQVKNTHAGRIKDCLMRKKNTFTPLSFFNQISSHINHLYVNTQEILCRAKACVWMCSYVSCLYLYTASSVQITGNRKTLQ